jgi:hypothetical protein
MTQYTDQEMGLRKRWLRMLLLLVGITAVSYIALIVTMPLTATVRSTAAVLTSYGVALTVAGLNCATYYVLYRTAYKKPGTKYLSFVLALSFVQQGREIVQLCINPQYGLLHGDFSLEYCLSVGFELCSVILTLYWLFLSIQLVKINKKRAREDYERAVETISSKTTSKELEVAYAETKKLLTSKYLKQLKKLYKMRTGEMQQSACVLPTSHVEVATV